MIRHIAFLYRKRFSLIVSGLLSVCLLSGCSGIFWTNGSAEGYPSGSHNDPIPPDVSLVRPPARNGGASTTPSMSPTDKPVSTPAVTEPPFTALVPLRDEVEDDFFSDAAFVGNSLMDGFRLFSGLTTCDYYAATSMTVVGINSTYAITLDNGTKGTIMQGLAQKEYGKVYILLGINEIGFETSYFIELYGKVLDEIRGLQPEADIYIMSITPVSAHKSANSDYFNMKRVNAYNEALLELANEKKCYYMDVCSALSDENGFLPSSATSDGVHFNVSHYVLWLNYVKTHYV